MASQTFSLKKDLLTIYALSALFSGGRLFVGAISVLFVLAQGISIGEFATIKSVQVATFLMLDIPTGIFISKVGSRNSILLMYLLSILGLIMYMVGGSFNSFLLAEFLLALSLCICPAAFADYTMDFLNQYPELIPEKIFHKNEMYTNIANIACGSLGGYLFTVSKITPYAAGIIVQVIGFIIAFRFLSQTSRINVKEKRTNFLQGGIKTLKQLNLIWLPIFLLIIIQFVTQPLYHYWQPLFYEINPQIGGEVLGFLFLAYSLLATILNFAFSKLVQFPFFRSIECVIIMMLISSVLYLLTTSANNHLIAFYSFTCLQGLLFTTLTCISAIIAKSIDGNNRAVILKFISFIARLGMLLSFYYIYAFLEVDGTSIGNTPVHNLYFQASIVLFCGVVFSVISNSNPFFLKRFRDNIC